MTVHSETVSGIDQRVAPTRASGENRQRILVWDWPTRIGHWLLVGSFALAWLTSDSEALRDVHVAAGYAFAAVVLFRLLWGVIGTRYARFAQFVKSPVAAITYLRSLATSRPQHTVGHNPAGALAILLLLGLGLITAASGWAVFNDLGGELLKQLHEGLAGAMLTVVVVHVLGVAIGSLKHRENLVRAMLSGYKRGEPAAAIRSARPLAGALLLGLALAAAWLALR